MPILFEPVSQPNDQDWIDLTKVSRDFPDPEQANWSDENYREWIQQRMDGGDQLYAARFNARLIGMVWLTPTADNAFTVERLCVRQVTRNRGVAAKFLSDLCALADNRQWQLSANSESAMVRKLLAKYGFIADGDSGPLQRKPA